MKKWIQKDGEGETKLHEEEELREWLKTAPSTAENRHLSDLLAWYDQEAGKKIPTPIVPPSQKKLGGIKPFLLFKWVSGIAATILLVFTFSQMVSTSNDPKQPPNLAFVDTFDDPDEAYEAAHNALMMLSTKMNATKKHRKKLKKIEILSDLVEFYKKK